ncbi:progranulin-like [Poeciliopsis prolifica]|uniref:progranulin-like n=1 Tax=Poeciliopsis prolifica TaxID=188132 RepID=UPI0024142F36|nr:progranulin-like [Poeciliopsis prolifica]
MLSSTLWLCVGVFLWGSAFCDIRCPDGTSCADSSTCCLTDHGYGCCPYLKAVCCADKAHCCPYGYRCDLATQMCVKQYQPWIRIPMVEKVAAEVPSTPDLSLTPFEKVEDNNVPDQIKSTVVYCDHFRYCPHGTTCCRHPKGAWSCCPYSPGRCCLDGYHCCPYGYDCDLTSTRCTRQGLAYPFNYKQALTSVPASFLPANEDQNNEQETVFTALREAKEQGVIRCDEHFYCPNGSRCCKGLNAQWNCCPN